MRVFQNRITRVGLPRYRRVGRCVLCTPFSLLSLYFGWNLMMVRLSLLLDLVLVQLGTGVGGQKRDKVLTLFVIPQNLLPSQYDYH